MKKNLSEEFVETDDRLVFKPENDIILCDSEGKEIEKVNKETVKDLRDKIDMVDDINKVEAKKVKYLESKLHLEEPSDVLVEHVLNEAPIPGDLARAYKKAGHYAGGKGHYGDKNTDLQKANYTKLTPEEAIDIAKKDPSTLKDMRLLMDGKLVKIRDTGYGETDYNFRNNYLPKEKSYVRRNGDLLRDTSGIHYKNLFKLADAIYMTNENSPEGKKDPAIMAARAENPESPNYNTYGMGDIAAKDHRGEFWGYGQYDLDTLSKKIKYYASERKKYTDTVKDLRARQAEDPKTQADYDYDLRYYKGKILDAQKMEQAYRDQKARMLNSPSELKLRQPIKDLKDIKKQLQQTNREINDYDEKENKLRTSGSQDTRYAKEQLNYYNSRLEEILREISRYEIQLEDAPQKDAEELKKIQKLKDETLLRMNDLEAKKADLFKKKKTENLLYQQIEQQNLVEEFEDLMDTIYPKGYDDANICEALEEQQELITESLELEVNDEE